MKNQWHTRRDEADAEDEDTVYVQRYDRGSITSPPLVRADGSVLFTARIAKPGILTYLDSFGRQRRELLLEEDLFSPESLASLGRATVTLEHPREDVSPDNVGELGVGDVDSVVEAANGFVTIRLAVRRRDALDAIARGQDEMSPGYRVRLDETPGTHEVFGAYDAIQRERLYNHVAIVDAARGGHDIRLRTDGAAYQIPTDDDDQPRIDSMNELLRKLLASLGVTDISSEDAAIANGQARIDSLKTFLEGALDDTGIRLDDIGALQKTLDKMKSADQALGAEELKKLQTKLKESEDALSGMTGERDTLKAAADTLHEENAKKKDAAERTRLDSFVVAAKIKLDGADKLDLPAYRKAIVADSISLPEDADASYVNAALKTIVTLRADSMGGDKADPWKSFNFDSDAEKQKRVDAKAKEEEDAARGDNKSLSERSMDNYKEAFTAQKGA